jgi:hypothetical protein
MNTKNVLLRCRTLIFNYNSIQMSSMLQRVKKRWFLSRMTKHGYKPMCKLQLRGNQSHDATSSKALRPSETHHRQSRYASDYQHIHNYFMRSFIILKNSKLFYGTYQYTRKHQKKKSRYDLRYNGNKNKYPMRDFRLPLRCK